MGQEIQSQGQLRARVEITKKETFGIKSMMHAWSLLHAAEGKEVVAVKEGDFINCPFHDDQNKSAVVKQTHLWCNACQRSFSVKDVISKAFDLPVPPYEDKIKNKMILPPDEERHLPLTDIPRPVTEVLKSNGAQEEITVEFQRRIEAASSAMDIPMAKVLEGLSGLGIHAEDKDCLDVLDSEDVTFADFCETFVDTKLTAKPRLRKGIRALKATSKEVPEVELTGKPIESASAFEAIKQMAQSIKPLDRWTDEELIQAWIETAADDVQRELSQRAHGRPFLVYSGSGTDMPLTLSLLKEARRRPTPEVVQLAGGATVKVYRIGHRKMWAETCPVHDGIPLFDGFCDKCVLKWSGVGQILRSQIWFQVHKVEEVKPHSSLMNELHQKAQEGLVAFTRRFPKAAIAQSEYIEANPDMPLPPKKIRFDQISEQKATDHRTEAFA